MLVKGIVDYDIVNYKKPSMFIAFPYCTFKCNNCQNQKLANTAIYKISLETIISRYTANPLTHAVVCGGLEPFDDFEQLLEIVEAFRAITDDDIVIYSGYYSYEITDKLKQLCKFPNIIIKFGRYFQGYPERYDETLGVTLASDNQFAVRLNNKPKILDLIHEKEGHCPCSLIADDTTLCCCQDFKYGDDKECHCGLYSKE